MEGASAQASSTCDHSVCPRGLTFTWWVCYSLNFEHKSTELARSFLFSSCVSFCLMSLSTVFHSINSLNNSPFSHSVLPTLLLPYWSFQLYIFLLTPSRFGELRTQKLNSHLLRTQRLKVLPSNPGAGQYMAVHATLTARDFFLVYFHASGPFTCIFFKTSPKFFSRRSTR